MYIYINTQTIIDVPETAKKTRPARKHPTSLSQCASDLEPSTAVSSVVCFKWLLHECFRKTNSKYGATSCEENGSEEAADKAAR